VLRELASEVRESLCVNLKIVRKHKIQMPFENLNEMKIENEIIFDEN